MKEVKVGGRKVEVSETLTDRVISWWDPMRGIERLRARTMMSMASGGYRGGRRDRRATRNWRPKDTSVNTELTPDLADLRGRSSDLVRNMPLAGGAIATVVTNVVGGGLTLKPAIDRELLGLDEEAADAWEAQARREFALFARHCDFTGALGHGGLQRLALRSVLELGDVLVVRRFRRDVGQVYGTKVQLIEAPRISNPQRAADKAEMIAGVELDADGRAKAYHVASRHPDDYWVQKPLAWQRVPAASASGVRVATLLFDRQRVDQARGAPYLAPIVETLKKLSDYTESELTAAAVSALFTVFIKQDDAADPDAPATLGSDASDVVSDPTKEIALEDAGAIVELDKGQSIESFNPNRPNSAFEQAVTAFTRHIGVGLELPYEVLIKHFTASYSASRAALEMAWQFFRARRGWLAECFCGLTYEWAIEEAIARGRLTAPGFFDDPAIRQAWLGAEWLGVTKINLDPKKESDADKQDVAEGFKTIAQVVTERTGGNFEDKHRQRVKETTRRREDGVVQAAPTFGAAGDDDAPEPPERTDDETTDDEDED